MLDHRPVTTELSWGLGKYSCEWWSLHAAQFKLTIELGLVELKARD